MKYSCFTAVEEMAILLLEEIFVRGMFITGKNKKVFSLVPVMINELYREAVELLLKMENVES